ncbi:MAG: complex I subunit 1 family protein [Candidatus Micrarchaeaceae archaeon]
MLIDKLTSMVSGVLHISGSGLAAEIIALVVYFIAIFILIGIFDYIFGWVERKVVAKVQSRHGPTYLGKFGILQNLADLLKLFAKENIQPSNADSRLFPIVIPIMLSLLIFIVAIIPFSQGIAASSISLGVLLIFVIISFFPIFIFLAGFSSGNKFGAISAQRSVLVLIAYELPMLLAVASVLLLANSYNFQTIVSMQKSGYFFIYAPISLFVFFIAMLAEFERPPFDVKEADSELIAGWLTDVSSPYYGLGLFIDYTRMLLGSMLIAIFFFGGWLGPSLPGIVWLFIKVFIIALFVILVRVATARVRIDRILRIGWIWLSPLAILNIAAIFLLLVK